MKDVLKVRPPERLKQVPKGKLRTGKKPMER
jgi:hypothetical protein